MSMPSSYIWRARGRPSSSARKTHSRGHAEAEPWAAGRPAASGASSLVLERQRLQFFRPRAANSHICSPGFWRTLACASSSPCYSYSWSHFHEPSPPSSKQQQRKSIKAQLPHPPARLPQRSRARATRQVSICAARAPPPRQTVRGSRLPFGGLSAAPRRPQRPRKQRGQPSGSATLGAWPPPSGALLAPERVCVFARRHTHSPGRPATA